MSRKIFVYNADTGAVNLALDIAHKLISPATYKCDLCSLTHGALKEKEAWTRFRNATEDELIFLHRDEFERTYTQRFSLPVVLLEKPGGMLEVLLGSEQIHELDSIDALISKLNNS